MTTTRPAWRCHVLISLVCLFSTQSLFAQRATVSGTVTDSSGAVLPGVTVEVLEVLSGGRSATTTTTGPEGRYSLDLPAGSQYELRVRRDGFAEEIVRLDSESLAVTNITLRIAPIVDTIVVTASRTPERLVSVTESVAIFTAEDIAASGSHSVADVIRAVPGMNVESSGREGSVTSLFSRGGESDYNLVLLDGVRMNRTGGTFDFGRISASEIERVEVVRGAQSAMYGSDAIGAVVQIFTKRPEPSAPIRVTGGLEGGTFNTWRGNMRIGGGLRRRFDYSLGVDHRGTDGAFEDLLPERDRYDQTVVDGAVGTAWGARTTLRSGIRYSNARGRSIGQVAYGARDTGTRYDTRDLTLHVRFNQQLGSRVNHSASAAYYGGRSNTSDLVADPAYNVYTVLEGTPGARFPQSPRLVRLINRASFDQISAGRELLRPGQFLASTAFAQSDFPFSSNTKFRRPALKYQADVAWAGSHMLSGGYEYERETDPLNAAFLVQNHAYFIQQQFNFGRRWFAGAGARVDDNTRFGTNSSPKVSLGGFLLPFRTGPVSSVKVIFNAGKGIKNPQFGELYDSAFSDGNRNLRPERARTLDGGVELTFAGQRWLGRIIYFDNKYIDQVAFRSSGPGLDGRPDFINIEGSKANGWEVDLAMQRPVFGVTAKAGYAFVDTEVTATVSTSDQFQPGQPLLRRPRHSGNGRIMYQRGRVRLNFDARYVGARHDSAFVSLVTLPSVQFPRGRPVTITFNPAYTLMGLGGEYQVLEDFSLYARVDNLANRYYESALGYGGLPRSVAGGLRFTIN